MRVRTKVQSPLMENRLKEFKYLLFIVLDCHGSGPVLKNEIHMFSVRTVRALHDSGDFLEPQSHEGFRSISANATPLWAGLQRDRKSYLSR